MKKYFKENLETILMLEWHGIHMEMENVIYSDRAAFYFSVPESSQLVICDDPSPTSNELIRIAKETLIDMIKKVSGVNDTEFVQAHVKFYAKTRKGEIWTKDLAVQRLKKLTDGLEEFNRYYGM